MDQNKKENRFQNLVNKAYFKQGLSIFWIGLALIICYYYINHFEVISNTFAKVNRILLPFYLGIVMAYLLCPVYNATVKGLYKLIRDKMKTPYKALKLSRVAGTVVAVLVIVVVVVGLIMMIIPNLY